MIGWLFFSISCSGNMKTDLAERSRGKSVKDTIDVKLYIRCKCADGSWFLRYSCQIVLMHVMVLSLSLESYLHKAQPHVAMPYTHDGTFQRSCDTSKLHAMWCDAFSNLLEFLLPILKYLSHLLYDFQMVYSIVMAML